ncbi:adenylate/guanylate cyclase domain-containing protein [Cypionkella sp.]|uniref:adenylate/guanylate cyclase domain-containing protein n=1 Tax=Cypionkella sp. TaxID=2811411 RepID=UPI002AB8191C|nr:adenylate/guanylate cyclase domain-containing protein [Cypionkella sp.]MDZ4395362.1 adenylate/guanylate cyclase domain-containing protein [Cypionkella sp.]
MPYIPSFIRDFFVYIWTGDPHGEAMPARVMAEIDRRETAAEQTISWAQLSIVGFLGMLYWVAPRAEGTTGENFVPMTLAAYLVFTLFRVFLSYRMVLPGWYLMLSMVVDVGLLCGMIFSFHIQYHQPPAFYLKSPTMIYLFFFIALRALRFDPRYVLMSGLIAASGWVFMVLYALTHVNNMHVTRNYVEYLTSNTILIGAEIDKVITLLGVTLILTIALFRARSVLFDAIQSHAAAEDLSQFFAPEVADLITQSDDIPGTGQGEVRAAAIMFVDVRGFTKTALALPPETAMRILAHYQQITLTEIEQHNGQIDKFMGDGILATFGAVQPGETYAADALRAASAVIAALDARQDEFAALGWPGRFATGVAVASGDVTVGIVGSQGRYEFTVIGHAVNLASKLESANKTQHTRALTDASTHSRAEAQGYVNPGVLRRDGEGVAGLAAPVDLVVLA